MSARRLVVLLCLAHVLSMTGFGTFPGLLPGFIVEWGLSNTEAGWINGVYFAAYMLGVPVLVALTDRVDPRRVYAFSAFLTAVSAIGFGWVAEGFWSATWFRALAGFGLAGTYMPGLKALTDHIGPAQQNRGVAFYTASFSIGSSLSFLLAGEIDAWLGWRWAFALSGGVRRWPWGWCGDWCRQAHRITSCARPAFCWISGRSWPIAGRWPTCSPISPITGSCSR
jgi:MFS family permease